MGLRVFIIDDSNIERIISETVVRQYGIADDVLTCGSANEGLGYLRTLTAYPEKLPDIILLDLNMPVRDGFDFLDDFLHLPESIQQHCTIFMVSATRSKKDFERIKEYPVIRKFFAKPLSQKALNDIHDYMVSIGRIK